MEENLFKSNPISYKMDRKSPAAIQLRRVVNRTLFDFMGNYTDDVLAEYIVVLVCNGKHQNQARDDLDAFLGEDSGKFVAWLWDHLAKENYTSSATLNSLDCTLNSREDVLNEGKQPSNFPDFHSDLKRMSDHPLPKDGSSNPLYCSTNSKVNEIPGSIQRWCPDINGSLTKDNNERLQFYLNEGNAGRLQAEPTVINQTTGAAYQTGAAKHLASVRVCPPEIPFPSEQLLDEYQQQKVAIIDSSTLLHRSLPAPRTEPIGRALRSIITDDHQSRPLPTRSSAKTRLLSGTVDSSPRQIARPRGNVWDRLGKPQNEENAESRGKRNPHENNPINVESTDYQGKDVQNSRSMWTTQNTRLTGNIVGESVRLDSNYCKVVPNNHLSECRQPEHSSNDVVGLPYVNNSKRKRLYDEPNAGNSSALFSGCEEGQHHAKETPSKTQVSFPVKFNRSYSFGKVTSDIKDSGRLFSESTCTPPRIDHNSPAHKADSVVSTSSVPPGKSSSHQLNIISLSATQTQKLIPKNSQLPSKFESLSKPEIHDANHTPVKDVALDVMSKLQQIETDRTKIKLCLKQTEMRNDAKPSAPAGVQNHLEEDIELRTVLVTNVHFAATREALLSHFTKCGSVAKVVMLTDTITAQPKGAAYVVFAHKSSAEKAVAMSGTSFFSRILTVMRKADMPADFLVPSPSSLKSMQQPFQHPSFWKGSNNFQWRRENTTNRESSMSASTNGLGSSATGE